MAEELTGPASEGADPAAVSLALSGASREKADAYLDDQRHHLHVQLLPALWEKWLGVLLRVSTAIVGLSFAGGLAFLVWDAAHSSGLIIEPFAVPADMAAKGLTGQVIASQMLDKLTAMQDATDSVRPPQSYENNWGSSLKVQIPETGISIGELQDFLKGWLGHDTHITGEVWRTPTGIAVTAREGIEAGATYTGPESDLDALIQKTAEHVYSVTQPYRYANFLDRVFTAPDIADRAARAAVIYRRLIAQGGAVEQGWAWYGLGTVENSVLHDQYLAVDYFRKSVAANPESTLGYVALGNNERSLGHLENGLAASLKAKSFLDRANPPNLHLRYLLLNRMRVGIDVAYAEGDYREALHDARLAVDAPEFTAVLTRNNFVVDALRSLAGLHDGGGVRATLLDLGRLPSYQKSIPVNGALRVAIALQDWPVVLQLEKPVLETLRQQNYRNSPWILAFIALAHAHMGDFPGAGTLIAQCPANSDDCAIVRGQIADLAGHHANADWWYARAEKSGPSIPLADAVWGQALLMRGQPDAAIAKFTSANQKGPHFADPLEGWGEALMAKNQSHLALAKFAEAEKYAPNWGRLHLKWGEALVYAGKEDEAGAHFARAAQLDLTPSEKSELAKHS